MEASATHYHVLLITILCLLFSSGDTGGDGGCAAGLLEAMPCVLFAEGAAPVPSTACCSALAGMQRRHPGCLCLVVNGTVAIPVPVNRYRILLLPALCRFHVSGDFEACGGAMKPPAPHERAPEYDSHRQPTPVPQPPQPPPPPPRIISGMLFGVSSGRKLGVDMLAFGILGLLA